MILHTARLELSRPWSGSPYYYQSSCTFIAWPIKLCTDDLRKYVQLPKVLPKTLFFSFHTDPGPQRWKLTSVSSSVHQRRYLYGEGGRRVEVFHNFAYVVDRLIFLNKNKPIYLEIEYEVE